MIGFVLVLLLSLLEVRVAVVVQSAPKFAHIAGNGRCKINNSNNKDRPDECERGGEKKKSSITSKGGSILLLMLLMMVSVLPQGVRGGSETTDRDALLAMKAAFTNYGSASSILATWVSTSMPCANSW
jgi:hypothetical protein